MLNSGGVNVYPAEVDAVLVTHPAVADAATVGAPDDEWGEQVKAAVELVPGVDPSDTVADEILRFAQALESNDELRTTLADPHVAAATRQQIVEDLLHGKASDVTSAAISMVVGAGRAAELPAIVDAMLERSAASRNKAVATVRSAVDLPDPDRPMTTMSSPLLTEKLTSLRPTTCTARRSTSSLP